MHKFLRAAGFSSFTSEQETYRFLSDYVCRAENLSFELPLSDGVTLKEFRLSVCINTGICAAILFLGERSQLLYYYPYHDNTGIRSEEICVAERHTMLDTYAGIIDEYRVGLSLIFFISNPLPLRALKLPDGTGEFRGSALSGFSNSACVILPIAKSLNDINDSMAFRQEQGELIERARNGDEDAIEILTETDMDIYQQVSLRIENEDLYSVVEQSFMPSGIECDQYSIIAEIQEIQSAVNIFTQEELCFMKLLCNEVELELCMRREDITGVPEPGRRIKCRIWLTGKVDFDNPVERG